MKIYIFTASYDPNPLRILKVFDSLDKAKEFGITKYNLCASEWTKFTSDTAPDPKWFYNGKIDRELIYKKHKTSYIDFCIVEMEVE